MSQVIRKYNSGGKSPEEPELFEWKDVGKYNKSDLISGLYRNVDTYITNNNLSGKKADAFRTATSRLIDGIKNGTVTLNGDGTFNVSDKSLSSTGQFDKNSLGGEKNTDNNANNRAGDYVLDYIKSMNTYKKPTVAAPKKEKFDFNKYFTGEVSRRWYGGNDIDNDNFFNRRSEEDRLKLMADIAGGITPEMLSGYDLEGTIGADEILNRSKRFVEAINNGTLDNNDYNAFAELGGGGLDRWLKSQEEQTAAVDVRGNLRKQWEAEAKQKGYTDEAIQAYIDNKQRALDEASQKEVDARNTAQEEKSHADAKAAEEERIRQLGASNIGNYNTISTLPEVTPYNFEGVYKSRYDNPWSLSFSAYDLNPDKSTQTVPLHREDGSGYYDSVNIGKTVPGTTAAQRLANDLDYYIRAAERNANDPDIKSQALEQLGSGEYVIPDSYNPNTGLIRVYNPKTRQLRWVEALTTQTGKDLFEEGYKLETAPKYKADGGILKAQQGETIDWNTRIKSINESRNKRTREAVLAKFKRIEEEEAAKKAAETKPSAANLTPEQRAARERKPAETGFTGVDIARLGAIGADIASMIPGLGGVGIAGTLANFGADIADDGMDLGDWGRLAGNIGLDVVGFIPGLGAAAKGSRVLKNVVKWAPRLLSIATAGNYGTAGTQSLQKAISTPKDLTVDDYRNIAEVIKVAIGGGRGIKRGIQSYNLKNAAKTGDYQITTNKGERKLTANQYNEIISHKKLADQNAALQLLLKDDDLNIPKKANWRMGTNSIIRHDYDFNKTKKVMTSKGEIEVPLVYSRSEKQITGNMQRSFPSIPGFEKVPQWYNAYKYRKLNADNPAEAKPSSSKPSNSKSTALVPGKVRGHDKRARELQSTFDTPVVMEPVTPAAKPIVMEPYVSKSKSKPKKPKARKKVSKDDRVTKKADGGLLIPKFQSPAAPIQRRNVRSADDLSWNNDILNSLGLKNTLGNITPANASKYNNMQGDYAKLGFGTSKPGDTSLTYDPNAAAYQTTFNNLTSVNQDTMSDLVRRGRITGRGGSSDKGTQWTADGLKGDQTFLRHLGTAATTKEGIDVLRSLVPDDIDVIKNLNQGMVNFMPKLKMAGITDGKGFNIPNTPIATTGLLDETVPDVEATPQDIKTTNNSGSYKLNTKGKAATNVLSGLRTLPEDIIALGRMVGGLRANRRAADKYKEGLKPLLVDTYENVVPITGNYLAKVSADKQASNLTSLAARPRTSDGSLQLAGELEAGNRAAQMRFQGDMADADMFNRTRTLAQQESDAAKARRTDVANRNRASMLQINAAKKQIDSARITNNYERVISPYLAGIEGRFRQNRAAGKQFDLEQARLANATKYRPQLQALQDRYLEAQKNNDQEGMKAAMNDYYKLANAQNQEMLAQRKKLTQMPWLFEKVNPGLFEKVNPVQAKIPYNKSGAKMNSADRIIMQRARDFNKRMLEDNKQLHKNINESKKQQADLIKHMSSLTAELIKKGMSWK